MKTTKAIPLSFLITVVALAGAGAQTFRTDINPALLYYQAFAATPDLATADRDFLWMTNNWQGQVLPKRFGELMAEYDSQFRLVQQAAHASVPCDWGIDMSQGPQTLLPQLARAKAVTQAARLRAIWDLQQGRPSEACDDLLAAAALGRNIACDGTLISVLVQISIEAIVCSTVAENFGQFPPDTLQRLAAGLDALPAGRTVADSAKIEKSIFADWRLRKIRELQQQNPGNDTKVMAGICQLLGFTNRESGDTNLWERLTQAAGGTSEGLVKLLEERRQAYDRVAVVQALPYPEFESQSKALGEEIQKSSNPFVSESFPALMKARAREFRIMTTLAMVHAAVAYKLHGDAGFQAVKDPCGNGPFAFQRFVFDGVDRGFKLTSALDDGGYQDALIFVEKPGPPFRLNGPHAGEGFGELPTAAEGFARRYGARSPK
jgi:hypothetical protein